MVAAVYELPIDIVEAAMAGIIAEYANAGVAPPPVAYLSTGDVVADGEQLTVSVVRMYGVDPVIGFPSEAGGPLQCTWWRAVELQVTCLRCAPSGRVIRDVPQPPTAEEFSAAASVALIDAQIITRGLVAAHRAEAFGPGHSFLLRDWQSISAQGGFMGGITRAVIGLGLV